MENTLGYSALKHFNKPGVSKYERAWAVSDLWEAFIMY